MLGFASASGCAALQMKTPTEKLKNTSKSFHENVRWQNFRVASQAVAPDECRQKLQFVVIKTLLQFDDLNTVLI